MGTAHAATGRWDSKQLTLLGTVGGQGPLWMRDIDNCLVAEAESLCQVDEVVFWDMAASPNMCQAA